MDFYKRLEIVGARTPDGWQVDLKKYGWRQSMEEDEELYRRFSQKGI